MELLGSLAEGTLMSTRELHPIPYLGYLAGIPCKTTCVLDQPPYLLINLLKRESQAVPCL